MKSWIPGVLVLLSVVAMACGDDSGGDGAAGTGAAGTGVPVTPPGIPPGGAGMGADDMMDMMDPTWTNVHTSILVPSCSGPLCHSGAAGELNLSDKAGAYAALINMPAMGMNLLGETNPTSCKDTGMVRVMPGAPEMSLLYAKVRLDVDAPCGNRMPTGSMLKPEQVEQIRMWIMNGALDD